MEPSPVRTRSAGPPEPRRPRTVCFPIVPLTFDSVMSCMWMPPSPVCASSSAPKPSGTSSVTDPSPVTMSQSPPGALPGSARTVTLPSPERARTLVSLPATVMLPSPVSTSSAPLTPSSLMAPSPVCAVTSPPRRRPRMLPSPERSCMRPVTRSMSIDPSPLLAATSDEAGSETISFADRKLLK